MTKKIFLLLCGLLISFQLFANGAKKFIRVACVGDSITYGSGIADRAHDSYPAQLSRMLGGGYDVQNFGVSGATMLLHSDRPYMLRSQYTNALNYTPDIIVILLGTNDSKHRGDGSLDSDRAPENWQHKADYLPDYEKMIAAFRQVNPNVKIFVCLPTPCFPGKWGINDKTIHDEIIPLVKQVAKDTGANVIDLNAPLADKSNLFPDTVHPNVGGAGVMAKTVYTAIVSGNKIQTNDTSQIY